MKKHFSILVAIILAVSMAVGGCNNGKGDTNGPSGSANQNDGNQQTNQNEEIELTFSHMFPATHPVHLRHQAWADAISEATNGKVKITFYFSETLLKAPDTYEGVVSGIANIGLMVPSYTPGLFPMLELVDLPVDYNSSEVISQVLWDCYNEFQPEELSKIKVLTCYAIGPGGIITKNPVRKLEDLSGKQIRSVGLAASYMSALGASPVSIAMPESYEALSKGVCDGVLNAWEPFITWKLVEVADYMTMTPFLYSSPFLVIMNLDTWNSLPPDIQAVFDKIGEEFVGYHGSSESNNAIIAVQNIIDLGKEIIVLSDEEEAKWTEAVKPAIEKAIADREDKGPARDFYNRMVELAEKYNADTKYQSIKDAYLEMVS